MIPRDLDALKRKYEAWPTDDLLRIVHGHQEYRPEAIAIAQQILAVRGVARGDPADENVVEQLQAEKVVQEELADRPLSLILRLVCVVFCGIPGIAIAAYYDSQGYSRRAKEAWKWVVIGWVTWLAMSFVCFLARSA